MIWSVLDSAGEQFEVNGLGLEHEDDYDGLGDSGPAIDLFESAIPFASQSVQSLPEVRYQRLLLFLPMFVYEGS